MTQSLSINQLKRALQIAEQIQTLETELASILGALAPTAITSESTSKGKKGLGKRQMSPAAREKIAAAQRARWAKDKGANPAPEKLTKKRKAKRVVSPEARAKMAAAQKARRAKERQA